MPGRGVPPARHCHCVVPGARALGHTGPGQIERAHALTSFTGAYDLLGDPIYREGGLLAQSVYRFKGQSAPAVNFTEIDFEQVDDLVLRKLFVGMTRARLKLVMVLSDRARQQLLDRM